MTVLTIDESAPFATPDQHVRVLHPIKPAPRGAVATVAHRRHGEHDGKPWVEIAVPLPDLERYCARYADKTDTYISQQVFRGWRRVQALARLDSISVDLDYHRLPALADYRPETVADGLLRHLDEVDLPPPSYVLATGRGLLATWLIDPVPRDALPRWRAVTDQLIAETRAWGSDRAASDAARVFRLAGTRHGRTGALVRPVWIDPRFGRWSLDDLAHEVLPIERQRLEDLRRAREEGRAARPRPVALLTAETYWAKVLDDLQSLLQLRWFGLLPPGQRDRWLFLAGVAMSWLVPPRALWRELHALACEATGGAWDDRETRARLAAVMRRAAAAARGETVEWQGQKVDPRYRFRASTIVEWLGITRKEMIDGNFKVIIDDELRRKRAIERRKVSEKKRHVPREQWLSDHDVQRAKPWEKEGINRATWYRRKARLRLAGQLTSETK